MKSMARSMMLMLLFFAWTGKAFEFHAPGQRPEVTRQAIAGLWKLTPALRVPMKEFTVHGKQPSKKTEDDGEPELLLMLKEDGSFQEYAASGDKDETNVQDSWKRYSEKRKAELAALAKGTWDYRDGKLILAADRPTAEPAAPPPPQQDTLLEGRVIARYETSLPDNPVTTPSAANTTATTAKNSKTRAEKRWDAHLAVQKATVKVGKFFYPKHHPSFFDQPIYNPAKRGAFQLRQILGSLNTHLPEDDVEIEKFQRSDFYNKTFLLTSHPLGQRQPKGPKRWSIKQNKFVEDPPTSQAAKKYAEDMENSMVKIRVMQVRFFPNNTFATIWGTGDAILRGKFDVIGQDKDSLWMTISRFGFGRSVSGSVFSEGRMLSQDDAKSYWGTIRYQSEDNDKEDADNATKPKGRVVELSGEADNDKPPRLEVRGSVLFGSGLEPMPVGRFIMRETDESFDSLLDEEDEEEDDDDEVSLPDISSSSFPDTIDEDGADFSSDDAFQ